MLEYKGNRSDLKEAVEIANIILSHGYIQVWLSGRESYDYTYLTPKQIMRHYELKIEPCRVIAKNMWQPWYRKTRAVFKGDLITINTKKIRSIESLVGTLIHEHSHYTNHYWTLTMGANKLWHHGDNSPVGKENSVPYYLGRMAKKFLKEIPTKDFLKYLHIEHS